MGTYLILIVVDTQLSLNNLSSFFLIAPNAIFWSWLTVIPIPLLFYYCYTLIVIVVVNVTVIYVCPPSHFSEVTWILGVRMLSEHSNTFEILEVDNTF